MKQNLLEVLEPCVGCMYHVSWASHGCVWRCISINIEKKTALLRTPKTRKEITVRLSDLRHTRQDQFKIESLLTPKEETK